MDFPIPRFLGANFRLSRTLPQPIRPIRKVRNEGEPKMATSQSQPQNALQLKRTFAAPRERVFRAWTDARQFAQWFGPTADYKSIVTEMDLRVGGTYRLVKPPEKLVFTWRWQKDENEPDTLVTLEFRDLDGSTEVTLTHDHF